MAGTAACMVGAGIVGVTGGGTSPDADACTGGCMLAADETGLFGEAGRAARWGGGSAMEVEAIGSERDVATGER